ncbi:MAG: hypothetical protein AVDCRST_MAG57-2437, partial [uncultured Blastococcus sp.]
WGAAERRPSRHAWPVSSSTAHPTPTFLRCRRNSPVYRRPTPPPPGRRTTTRTTSTPTAGRTATPTTAGPPVHG